MRRMMNNKFILFPSTGWVQGYLLLLFRQVTALPSATRAGDTTAMRS